MEETIDNTSINNLIENHKKNFKNLYDVLNMLGIEYYHQLCFIMKIEPDDNIIEYFANKISILIDKVIHHCIKRVLFENTKTINLKIFKTIFYTTILTNTKISNNIILLLNNIMHMTDNKQVILDNNKQDLLEEFDSLVDSSTTKTKKK
jgi:hypothetical protein